MREVIAKIGTHDDPKRFEDMGVKVFFGDGRFIDRHTFKIGEHAITSKMSLRQAQEPSPFPSAALKILNISLVKALWNWIICPNQ